MGPKIGWAGLRASRQACQAASSGGSRNQCAHPVRQVGGFLQGEIHPDRGRAPVDLIEPARHLAIEKNLFRKIKHAKFSERWQQRGRADKACTDDAIGFLDHAAEIGLARLLVVIGNETMQEGERPGGLVIMRDPTGGRKELCAEGGADCIYTLIQPPCLVVTADDASDTRRELCRDEMVESGGTIVSDGRSRFTVIADGLEPVAKSGEIFLKPIPTLFSLSSVKNLVSLEP